MKLSFWWMFQTFKGKIVCRKGNRNIRNYVFLKEKATKSFIQCKFHVISLSFYFHIERSCFSNLRTRNYTFFKHWTSKLEAILSRINSFFSLSISFYKVHWCSGTLWLIKFDDPLNTEYKIRWIVDKNCIFTSIQINIKQTKLQKNSWYSWNL
mgnify:CR=1 FL=1